MEALGKKSNRFVRILRAGTKIFGAVREYGELIPAAEFYALNPVLQNSLISSDTLEIVVEGNELDSRDRDSMAGLHAQVETLRHKVAAIEKLLESTNSDKITQDTSTRVQADVIKLTRSPKKGDSVRFLGENDTELEGSVKSASAKNKRVKVTADGSEWELGFNEVTVMGDK